MSTIINHNSKFGNYKTLKAIPVSGTVTIELLDSNEKVILNTYCNKNGEWIDSFNVEDGSYTVRFKGNFHPIGETKNSRYLTSTKTVDILINIITSPNSVRINNIMEVTAADPLTHTIFYGDGSKWTAKYIPEIIVDLKSNQSISGQKSFNDVTHFKSGLSIGLFKEIILGLKGKLFEDNTGLYLQYDTTKISVIDIPTKLSNLKDVSIESPAISDLLIYQGLWTNVSPTNAGILTTNANQDISGLKKFLNGILFGPTTKIIGYNDNMKFFDTTGEYLLSNLAKNALETLDDVDQTITPQEGNILIFKSNLWTPRVIADENFMITNIVQNVTASKTFTDGIRVNNILIGDAIDVDLFHYETNHVPSSEAVVDYVGNFGSLTFLKLDASNGPITGDLEIFADLWVDGNLDVTGLIEADIISVNQITGLHDTAGECLIYIDCTIDVQGLTIDGIPITEAYLRLDGTNIPTSNYSWITDLTTTKTITAEQFTSTDDIIMQGHLLTLGNETATDIVISFKALTYDATITFDESDNEFDFGSSLITTTGTLRAGVGTLSGNNANATFTLLNLNNTDTPESADTFQTSDLVFNLTGQIGVTVALHEAAKISAYKVSDWFHASDETDHDSGLKFYTTHDGTSTLQLTIDDVGLATFVGNISTIDLTLTGGDLIASASTTFNVFNTFATTINAFGVATAINMGAASGAITFGSNSTINGGTAANDDITIQGTTSNTRTTSYVNLQPNGGNVGIGTATPTDTFDVAGGIRVTSDMAWDATKPGRINKSTSFGLLLVGVTGSTADFTLASPTGTRLIENPKATNNFVFGPTGAVTLVVGSSGEQVVGAYPYLYIYGRGPSVTDVAKYGRINVDAAGDFNIESQSGNVIRFITGGADKITIDNAGDLIFSTIAKGIVLKQGSNGKCGTFTATGITPVTVANTSIAITDTIVFSLNSVGGTVGAHPTIQTIAAATSFTVACTALDTSIYNYVIISNAA